MASYSQKIIEKISKSPDNTSTYLVEDKRVNVVILDMDTVSPISTNIKFKQFDYGSSSIDVKLVEGVTPMNINDKVIVGVFKDLNGNVFVDNDNKLIKTLAKLIDTDEGAVRISIPKDILKVEGRIECEIIVFNSDSSRLTSPRFNFYIEPSLYDHDYIASLDLEAICGELNCNDALCGQGLEITEEDISHVETSLDQSFINRFGGVNNGLQ